ncbi:RtcB family protein [Escherichia coli]|nr:RtcB family protein [Escherichia coli]
MWNYSVVDGAKSFIVRGLGNEESFCSCSHGAGRVMSRTKAKNCSAWKIKFVPPRMWNAVKMPK